jgi:hypothetical protein
MPCLTFTGPPSGARGSRETRGAHEGMLALKIKKRLNRWTSERVTVLHFDFDLKQEIVFQIEIEIHLKQIPGTNFLF